MIVCLYECIDRRGYWLAVCDMNENYNLVAINASYSNSDSDSDSYYLTNFYINHPVIVVLSVI